MGTSKCGRYLNTHGGGRTVSDYALVHSSEGKFRWKDVHINGKPAKKIRLDGGGHGQKGMNLLDKYHIEYHVVKEYQNGVRTGYIPDHAQKNKRSGIGQTWFPKTCTDKDIRHAGEHVAGLKVNRKTANGVPIFGNYKGVRVGVIRTNGKIATVFPDINQPSKKEIMIMYNYNSFKNIIKKRASINDEWSEGVEIYWKELTDVFSADIEASIRFLNEECSADEFSWLSEVFDRIAEQTHSMRFIETLRNIAQKYPYETKKYNILSFIDEAQSIVEDLLKKDTRT